MRVKSQNDAMRKTSDTLQSRLTFVRRCLRRSLNANFPNDFTVRKYREEYDIIRTELMNRKQWIDYCMDFGLAFEHDGDSISV